MLATDIRAFIPAKDFQASKRFYQAIGFSVDYVSEDLSLCTNGTVTFFLQNFYNEELAKNLMFQLCVEDIVDAFKTISGLSDADIKYQGIKQEHWGKVMYLWGPSGELWHITELNR